MKIPLVDLKAQYRAIEPEVQAALTRVLNNTSFVMGKEVSDFEEAFARFVGSGDAAGVASGTAALHLSLRALGVGPGDEVITTSHTFIATGEAVSMTGAKPVFVDIDEKTYCLDPALVEKALTPATKAILPVHLYGHPADMKRIMDIAQRHGIYVVEDAAQAHGARLNGQACGAMGDLACFSFYPGKNLGAYGDGGAVTGNRQDLMATVKRLRNHGRTTKYEHEQLGFGERLDGLQAAILGAKLPHLGGWTALRQQHAQLYTRLLSNANVITPYVAPGATHVYHLYVIRTKKRQELLDHLISKGIEAGIHYPIPLHMQPAYVKLGYRDLQLAITEKVVDEIISLPMYPELTEGQIEFVCGAVKEVTG
jgi:dTDP-4-amino-4,6-dideoxygalactose transaminase